MRTILLGLAITVLGVPVHLSAQKCDVERAACHWFALKSDMDNWSCELDYWDCYLKGIRTS